MIWFSNEPCRWRQTELRTFLQMIHIGCSFDWIDTLNALVNDGFALILP